ncbi:Ferredoxin (Iron-sulfur cluster-binding protein) [Desulfamplus magnetovallimortis]|uniref:Ferredoxin (Iron-sulfur cluster-binding protein) n=1 Tax=Desulfamplus magnetovallimortis TaxID=1246637 RepID=A0A1W1HB56_9BACT|nr:ATP-binding protein [Desulfamplus magnetovallimortis]SLM29710.1 Ferredoxin (Iron-sulfur cluster-binding protein) [Desulfamplus magnetovallimortis]
MKELTVISGKGGTGKTSVTASLATLAPNRIVIDADVDAANLFLTLEHEVLEKESFEGGHKAMIDEALCTRCGECLERCQFDAVSEVPDNHDAVSNISGEADTASKGSGTVHTVSDKSGKFVIDPVSCEGCGVCVHFCPADAISFERQICGEKYISKTANGPMIHARLGIAEENSGLLVSQLRQKAKEMAIKEKIPMIITDGPPGIGCPVIASVSNADAVLIVTEPTQSGMHDMARVKKLADQMNAAVYLCVNKADLNPEATDEIKKFCHENGISFAGEIPFDRDVIESMKAGKSLVTFSQGPASVAVKNVWQNVLSFMEKRMDRLT